MGTSVNNSTTLRRRVGIGIGLLLALAQVPLTVAAASSGGSSTTASGVVINVTKALTAQSVSQSDYVSSGWAISMSGKHPAATVQLTNISATVPLTCQVNGQHPTAVNLALRMPDASQSFTANDTAWHPTSSAADAHGYQVSVSVGDLCHNGALTPHGNATYTAKLVSSDTKDVFTMRFHTVDARTNKTNPGRSNQVNPNTDCTSASQNHNSVAQCNAAWTPLTTSAAIAPVTAAVKTVVGLVTNVTKALTGQSVNEGDYISSGWAISMPGNHPAATVALTNISATIPLICQVSGQHPTLVNLVVPMPDASQSFTANDTAWHPTSSVAGAQGYQASAAAGNLCHAGALTPHGNATYTAKLASSDTKDLFAMRFHTVDARTNQTSGSNQANPNTDCTSSHNYDGLAQCTAAWTLQTTSTALAAVATAGGGSGGTVTGTVGGIVASIGNLVTLPALLQPITGAVLAHRTTGSQSSHTAGGTPASTSGAVSGATPQPAPVLVLPAPAQSTVLGPVPLPVPVIDSVAAGVGGALPWRWFLLLAILDLGLIVGIVIRRRSAQRARLNPQ